MRVEDSLNKKQVNKNGKSVAAVIAFLVVVIALATTQILSSEWPTWFRSDLNRFFGDENWKCVDEEAKDSIIYSIHLSSRNVPVSEDIPGKYKNWYIETEMAGETALFRITNHTLKINHDRYSFLQPNKRLTANQALIIELMDISHQVIAFEVWESTICPYFTEEQAEWIDVEVMYRGGNPSPSFYNELWQESWFTINATAEDYLETDLYDFYLLVRLDGNQVEKLTKEQLNDLMSRYDQMIDALLDQFGKNADLEILFGSIREEYVDGERKKD